MASSNIVKLAQRGRKRKAATTSESDASNQVGTLSPIMKKIEAKKGKEKVGEDLVRSVLDADDGGSKGG
ncbi:hypothetical protein RIF29_14278 [Crotalaria pallida]|uniref:Uncharacterized protein n=1 Tax=Crotalaria pallida TaxID=3830 RepID=A0AAN9FD19_CROPI